ncbi:MAG: dephospho-CoA kinase [Gammaproteobacteria bacterium]
MGEDVPAISTYVVGVTGGIGSGKTTVCDLFTARHAVPVVDADVVAREVVEPGTAGLAEIVRHFGHEVLDDDGRLDRRRLKRIVFADGAQREQLEAILHPRIRDRMTALLAAVTTPYGLLCVPLLAEGGRRELMRRVLVVDCPEAVQIARVRARDDLTADEVAAIMRTQASREQRLAIADDVIVNDGDTAALELEVDTLHERYLALAREAAAAK